MNRILTALLATLTALLLAATLAPAQAASPSDKSLTLGSTDARRAPTCEADTDVPARQRSVQICVNQKVGTSFNFFGKVKPYGKYKKTVLQYRPIKRVGDKWACRTGVKWQDTSRTSTTDGNAFYSYKGISKVGCYRVKVRPKGVYLRSFSIAFMINPR